MVYAYVILQVQVLFAYLAKAAAMYSYTEGVESNGIPATGTKGATSTVVKTACYCSITYEPDHSTPHSVGPSAAGAGA